MYFYPTNTKKPKEKYQKQDFLMRGEINKIESLWVFSSLYKKSKTVKTNVKVIFLTM